MFFFSPFLVEDFSALSEFFCLRLLFRVPRSRNPSIRFALTHPCATGQYRLVLYTAICSALVRFYVFHTRNTWRRGKKNTWETFNESATSIMTMCSTAAAIVGATFDLAAISVEGAAILELAQDPYTLRSTLRQWSHANRTDGTNKATSETQVMCVVWLAQVQIHGDG